MQKKRFCAYMIAIGLAMEMVGAYYGDAVQAKGRPQLSKKKLSLRIGDKAALKVKNTKKKVKWISRDPDVAKVSKKGVVKAIQGGKTKVIAKTGQKKMVCKVTVKEKVKTIEYKNNIFDKETYKNIKYITQKTIYHKGEKVSSKEGISAIYKALAGLDPLKDISSEQPMPPAGGTAIEFVMKDGTVETVNVSGNIWFRGKCYQPTGSISDTIAALVKKYIN